MPSIMFSILIPVLLGVAAAGRSEEKTETDSSQRKRRDLNTMLKIENTYLHDEVKELRHELQVAASGTFARKRQGSSSSLTPGQDTHPANSSSFKGGISALAADVNAHAADVHAGGLGNSIQAAFAEVDPLMSIASRDTSTTLSIDLQDISEAIANEAEAAAKLHMRQTANVGSSKDAAQNASKTLFILYSNSKFYDTRLRWALDTWAKDLPASNLLVIGDGQATNLTGVNTHQTLCKPQDQSMTMCCRYAEAVVVAQNMMKQNPALEWVYLADDDSYIRVPQLEKTLLTQGPTHPRDAGLVLGNYGCATSNCNDLLCGGSGYAANRWAIDILASGDPTGFVQEMMKNCQRCGGDAANSKEHKEGRWGDAGLSEVITQRGIERRTLEGAYGWMLDKSCLQYSLENEKEPVMYHMIRSKPQMEMLHRLFATVEQQTGSSVPATSNTALDGLGGCVEFKGNVQCAASRDDEDRPWHRGPSLCIKPRMPRLPILLGVFTLVLLAAILMTFMWAGIKYQQWDGWKMQGLNWQKHSVRGR